MNQEKCSLTWHTYSDHLKNMMKDLMMNEDFSDVTLVTEDKKQIKANINILSACSPVFRDILKKEKNSNQIMYLRGIQFSELESIMQFIYLGEATFYEERMDELFAVAKSLEISELCKAETEKIYVPEHLLSTVPGKTNENLKEQTLVSDHLQKETSLNGKYEFEPCQKTFQTRCTQTVYNSKRVKYACDQCDYQGEKSKLTRHIEAKHGDFMFACDQCDYSATRKDILTIHIQSKHEGIRYACDQCDYKAHTQSSLNSHSRRKHKGFKLEAI